MSTQYVRKFNSFWGLAGICLALIALSQHGLLARTHVRYFPMIALNKDAQTAFLLHNPGVSPIRVAVHLRAPNASDLISEEVVIGALETRRLDYPGDVSKATGGWAELSSQNRFLATELILAGPSEWIGVPEATPSKRFKVFGMVAIPKGLQTGLALTNPNRHKSATVELLLRSMDGAETRRKKVVLAPLSNTSG